MLGNISTKKLVTILGIVFIVSGLISGVVFFMQYGISGFNPDVLESYENNVDVEKQAVLQGINTMRVETASTDVTLISTDSNEVNAHFYGGYSSSSKSFNPELVMTKDGDTLLIKIEDNVNGMVLSFRSNLKLDVYIPSQYSESFAIKTASGQVTTDEFSVKMLSIETSSGDINTDAMNADKALFDTNSGKMNFKGSFTELSAKSTSGDIISETVEAETSKFESNSGAIKISGNFANMAVKTTSGDIKAETVSADKAQFEANSGRVYFNGSFTELDVKSTSGDIISDTVKTETTKFESGSGAIKVSGHLTNIGAKTTSGDISLSSSEKPQIIQITTGSGETKLKLPDSAGFKLACKSSSGEINSDFPVTVTKTGSDNEHELNGTVGDGSGSVTISSSSGDIRIIK